MRTICILVAILFIARCLHQLNARPVRVQFIGHDARQRRAAAASHLRAVRDDVGCSIRVDRQVNVRLKWCFRRRVRGRSVCCRGEQLFRYQPDAEHERTGSEHALEESPPAVQQLTIAGGNMFDSNHAPSLRHWPKMDAKPCNVMLHPTANSFSCKPGGQFAEQLVRKLSDSTHRKKWRVAISERAVQSEPRQNDNTCPQSS